MKNDLSTLIKAAALSEREGLTVSDDLERRVMIEVAHRAIERSHRRARLGLVASLSGLAMLLAACIAVVVVWFPTVLPSFTRLSWLEKLQLPSLDGIFSGTGVDAVEALPFFEQWGGLTAMILLVGGAAGFIYYLNGLFADSSPS